jgi:hypothetical protein
MRRTIRDWRVQGWIRDLAWKELLWKHVEEDKMTVVSFDSIDAVEDLEGFDFFVLQRTCCR